jgi:diguanylate cyclase (GGDEF)-like protein
MRDKPRIAKKDEARRARPADARQRAKPETGAAAPKSRSLVMRLAAEVDALKEALVSARARVAELETRVDEDPLTGVLNRRGFERVLARALAFVRRYDATAALVYLDLDNFKPVNDHHGHAVGDWVLARVARLIAGHVRASDVVARLGGDEFVVLLWNVSEANAAEKALAFEALIEGENFAHQGNRLAAGLSAGTVMLAGGDTVERALERADEAMYARKRMKKASA